MVTPNWDAIGHDAFGPDWRGLETPRHLYLYGRTSIERLAREAGFGRVHAFSHLRDRWGADFMIAESRTIAERAGHARPPITPAQMVRRSLLAGVVGQARGEWVVLIARK